MRSEAGNYPEARRMLFDAHGEDPRRVRRGEVELPVSVVYHERLLWWVERLEPEAGEAVRLAAAAQHLRRWRIPRGDYPEGRLGYKRWRSDLAEFHGEEAAGILRECGYGAGMIDRVRALIRKENFASDAEGQLLQDAVCLVFLEQDLEPFAAGREEGELLRILRKTLRKMSVRGRAEAGKLLGELPEAVRAIVHAAMTEAVDESGGVKPESVSGE